MHYTKKIKADIEKEYERLSQLVNREVGVVISKDEIADNIEYIYDKDNNILNLLKPMKNIIYTVILKENQIFNLQNTILDFVKSKDNDLNINIEEDENINWEFENKGRMTLNNGIMKVTEKGMFNNKKTTDLMVVSQDQNTKKYGIIVIKRKKAPMGWALAGGTVETTETYTENSLKELEEELGDKMITRVIKVFEPIKCYELRGSIETQLTVFYSDNAYKDAEAGDDAADTEFIPIENLEELIHSETLLYNNNKISMMVSHKKLIKEVLQELKTNNNTKLYFNKGE